MRKVFIAGIVVVGALAVAAAALAGGGYGGYGDDSSGTSGTQSTQSASTTSTAGSETYSFKATLTRGAEVPKPKGAPVTAGGSFVAKSVEAKSGITIRWTLKFHGLSGKAVAAHIHMGKVGVSGPVVVPLCGPCKATSSGSAKIPSKVEDALEKGKAYVNVHTVKNAAGEIRGQVKLTGK
jgi:LysM repeat protein